jgi:hypothetical protein
MRNEKGPFKGRRFTGEVILWALGAGLVGCACVIFGAVRTEAAGGARPGPEAAAMASGGGSASGASSSQGRSGWHGR